MESPRPGVNVIDRRSFHDTGTYDGDALRRALSRKAAYNDRMRTHLGAVTEALSLLPRSRVELGRGW